MYKKKHIIIHSDQDFSKGCNKSCQEFDVLHFHIKKNAKNKKKDALMFFPKDGGEIEQVMDLHKSFYSDSDITVSNGINSFHFVPQYDTSDYRYYRGQGINSIINDARTHHFETLDGNKFLHNIDRNTLFGPITDITTEATDLLFGKSEELSKSQTTISFPNHPEIDSKQSSNVFPTSMASGVTRRGQSYLDRKIGTALKDVQQNFGDGRTLKQATYNKKGKSDSKTIQSGKDTGRFYPGKVHNFAVANPIENDAAIHHEANHKLTDRLIDKFGYEQVHNLYDTLVSKIHPKIRPIVNESLVSRGYEIPNDNSTIYDKLAHKEELVNAVRDITQKGHIRDSLGLKYDPSKPHDHEDNIASARLDGRIKNSWKDIVNHAKNHKFSPINKSELAKGSFQRRTPFNPKEIPVSQQNAIGDWQVQNKEKSKYNIDRMEGNLRSRALNKLASATQVKNINGKMHFLLHRGMGSDEKNKFIGKDQTGYPKEHINSWSTSHNSAYAFGDDDPVSAWVSEDDIHHVPLMTGRPHLTRHTEEGKKLKAGKNMYRHENEVLVSHSVPHNVVKYNEAGNLNNKINRRFDGDLGDKSRYPAKNLNANQDKIGRIMSTPKKIKDTRKLAASEEMDNTLQKAGAIKNAVVAGVTGLGFLNAPTYTNQQQNTPKAIERTVDTNVSRRPTMHMSQDGQFKTDPQEASDRENKKRDAFLHAISMNESSGGKNMNYPPGGGMHGDDRAFSKYGIMPILARESINRHPELKEKYGHLLSVKDNNLLGQLLEKHNAGQDIAEHRYKYLRGKFNDSALAMAHAWRRGVKGTNDAIAQGKDIFNTDYVKKFNKNYINSL